MSPKAWMINLVLAVVVVFLGIKAYDAWSKTEKRLPEAGDGKPSAPVPHKTVAKADIPAESEYESVVSHNLFSVSRSPKRKEKEEPEEKSKGAEPDPKLLKLLQQTVKQISIYGVMMVGGEKKALIKGPAAPVLKTKRNGEPPPPRGEAITWVKVGDPLNRFTVKEITARGVVLGAEGLRFDVVLYDEHKPKKRDSQKKETGPVVIRMEAGTPADAPPEKDKAQASGEERPEKDKAQAPEEKSPEKKLPIEAGQKQPDPAADQKTEPEKR